MKYPITLTCVVIGIVYIFLINPISLLIATNISPRIVTDKITEVGGSNVQLGVSDEVSVTVTRNRWYGQLNDENGIQVLYLFKMIKIPLKTNSINFLFIHEIVLVILVGLPIKEIIDKRRLEHEHMD